MDLVLKLYHVPHEVKKKKVLCEDHGRPSVHLRHTISE